MIGIEVFNSVGNISTSKRKICELATKPYIMSSCFFTDTTDVQNITATLLKDMYTYTLQCIFVTGSNARGCVVVLVSKFHNTSVNLTREDSCVSVTVNVTATSSNIYQVFGFDIESDGSVRTIAVPGGLLSNVTLSCSNDITIAIDHSDPPLSKFCCKDSCVVPVDELSRGKDFRPGEKHLIKPPIQREISI